MSSYVLYEEIGSGAYGRVFRGICARTRLVAAVKVCNHETPKQRLIARNEIDVMAWLWDADSIAPPPHPAIIRYVAHESWPPLLVTEFFAGGRTLYSLVVGNKIHSCSIATQLLCALAYLHERLCAHRDIKLENVLVDDAQQVRLIDFGFACSPCSSPALLQAGSAGTLIYWAPELHPPVSYVWSDDHGARHTTLTLAQMQRADVFALGVLLYELVTASPFGEEHSFDGPYSDRQLRLANTHPPPPGFAYEWPENIRHLDVADLHMRRVVGAACYPVAEDRLSARAIAALLQQ